ncbi:protein RETICULATA-RELATED 1, chloroplastic-like [Senna tora]|uniref:Protein RETICULATA-RELATED 1, chloroplastic-like n=1 Tax=Senna tora TaxID=362788 RepID=A0A834XE88_9FABA|nr:protein RETICULATA-RELATED 1, chloroplastic-like [Senna tora]
MSLAVFQTAQIMPMNSHVVSKALPPNPSLPIPKLGLLQPAAKPAAGKNRRRGLVVKGSSTFEVDNGSAALLERCFELPAAPGTCDSTPPSSSSSSNLGPVMKGQYGSLGSVTLEKSKLDMTQKQTKSSPQLDVGGGGGGIGKKINHGGGDGGDDDGDDDDYFDDFDDGDEGDEGGLFRRRILLEELFDRKFVDAVLNEWQRTMLDLPAGLRQAYEMGLVSSAQMVKFLAINARPTTSRFISRSVPQGISRAFIGR